jgi:RNA polymerase sigma-70 factor (ECF subfamily)
VEGRPLAEADLIERARSGDVTAFEALVRAHQEAAVRTAWVVSGGLDDAEDAAQEAFVRAFAALPRFRTGSPFRPWLLAIVANEARNRRRSAGRRSALALRLRPEDPTIEATAASPEAAILAREGRAALLAGLARLAEADREIITLRYLMQLSEAETASALEIPSGTAKSRLSRGLARLRDALADTEPAS